MVSSLLFQSIFFMFKGSLYASWWLSLKCVLKLPLSTASCWMSSSDVLFLTAQPARFTRWPFKITSEETFHSAENITSRWKQSTFWESQIEWNTRSPELWCINVFSCFRFTCLLSWVFLLVKRITGGGLWCIHRISFRTWKQTSFPLTMLVWVC